MKAFHSNWTKPYVINNGSYNIQDYEILITILSALKWREKNGSIKMITDKIGEDYYKSIGIESIWDLGIESSLDDIAEEINPSIFWAAGKIYALAKEAAPIIMLDTDFIIWNSIDDLIKKKDIATIHYEEIDSSIYPSKEYFKVNDRYKFDQDWDWNVKPCNTAFAYINNKEFKDEYTSSAIEFMKNLRNDNNKVVNMVFAEQRIISMSAKKMGLEIFPMEHLENLVNGNQKKYTHIWGYKRTLNENELLRQEFCNKIIKRIKNDFPQYVEMLKNIEVLNKKYVI